MLGLTLALVFIKENQVEYRCVARGAQPMAARALRVIAVPTELTNDVALTVLANMITLTRGH